MAMLSFMWNTALIAGALAAGYWFLRGQSIHKGFGFTLHWWAVVDLLAGMLITTIAMLGIFLVLLAAGGIRMVSVQLDAQTLLKEAQGQMYLAPFEEILSRSLQLNGLYIAIGLLLAVVVRKRLGGTFENRMDKTLVWATWPAILAISLLFGYLHINDPGATYVTAFGNALGGLMYGIAFMGGRNIWLPVGMHFAWNYVQGPLLGFNVSGNATGSLITQELLGRDLLTGGTYGVEGGLVGMAFRFVVIALVLYYLYLRAGRRGSVKRLEFPIKVYANPPRPRQTAAGSQGTIPAAS